MTKIVNQNYPNGLNPLGYMGVNAPTPGQQVIQLNRAPTPTDAQNFTIGTQWLATVSGAQQIWELVSLAGGVATWVQLYPAGGGSGGASEFPTDSGTANEVGGVLQIKGDGENIATEGSGNLINVVLNDHITIQNITVESMSEGAVVSDGSGNLTSIAGSAGQVLTSNGAGMAPTFKPGGGGGGGITTLTANTGGAATASSIKLQGNNIITTNGVPTGEIDFSLVNGTNGQLLIGGGAAPTWASITAGTNITLTPGANSLTIAATGTAPAASCAFFYYQSAFATNVTGDNTLYGLGATIVLTRLYDLGTNVTPGDGAGTPAQFTAPATGLYFLNIQVSSSPNGSGAINVGTCVIQVTGTSAQQYAGFQGGSSSYNSPRPTPANMQLVIPMTAGDVATFQFASSSGGGIKNASIGGIGNYLLPGSALFYTPTWICGYRVA